MQDFPVVDPEIVNKVKATLSGPRFARYLDSTGGDQGAAMALYQWNTLVSQSLYVYLQCWEVALRNKLDSFLRWKYNDSWPYDSKRAVRNLARADKLRVIETIGRQERQRDHTPVSTDAIVADLSAGFWVSQLSSSYVVTYSWRYNFSRVFPNDASMKAELAWPICDRILTLRNRIAHHEPIYGMNLNQIHAEMRQIVNAMCEGTAAFADANCTFQKVNAASPVL